MRRTLAAAICSRRLSAGSSGWPAASASSIARRSSGDQEVHLQRDLFGRRLAAQLLHQPALGADLPVDALHHVHGDADRARLVGDGPADRLADPPGGIGAELEAQRGVELLHRPQQADVALLDQVQERHAAADVALGHADHQAQVGLRQALLGVQAALRARAQARSRSVGIQVVRLEQPRHASLPSRIALARVTSSSLESRAVRPISCRYMRTGSLVAAGSSHSSMTFSSGCLASHSTSCSSFSSRSMRGVSSSSSTGRSAPRARRRDRPRCVPRPGRLPRLPHHQFPFPPRALHLPRPRLNSRSSWVSRPSSIHSL